MKLDLFTVVCVAFFYCFFPSLLVRLNHVTDREKIMLIKSMVKTSYECIRGLLRLFAVDLWGREIGPCLTVIASQSE